MAQIHEKHKILVSWLLLQSFKLVEHYRFNQFLLLSSELTLLYAWLKYYNSWRTEHQALFRNTYKTNFQQVGETNTFIQCTETEINNLVVVGKEKITS